jgi:hypothetical protein
LDSHSLTDPVFALRAVLLEAEMTSEREQLNQQRTELIRERIHLDQQWHQVAQLRAELERRQAGGSLTSTRDTIHDATPPDRLESARRLLRQLAERRNTPAPQERPAT